MNPSHALYRIQRVDLKLHAQRRRVKEIDAELASNEAVTQAKQTKEAIDQQLRPAEARANDLNLELQSIAAQRKQFSAQFYGGGVSNPKELQAIEHKIEALARRQSELETELLETMMTVDDLKAQLDAATATLSEVEAALASEHGVLLEERQQVRLEIRKLKAQREKLVAETDAEALALYDEMWRPKLGRPVAVMDGDRCKHCGVSQTEVVAQRVRRGQEIVFCANCGRILITR